MTSRTVIGRLKSFATQLNERIQAMLGPGQGRPSGDGRSRIFFVIHNKNHMTIFNGFAHLLEQRGFSVFFVTIGGHRHQSQAIAAVNVAGRTHIDVGEMGRMATPGDAICAGNDWGPKRLISWLDRLKARGVPLIGVVEGARFGLPRLYKRVDELLCWGASGLEIGARAARVTGSPVIEAAAQPPRPTSARPRVLVNYKFSGTAEDEGFVWGAAALAAAREIDPDFIVTTHPSSRGVLDDVKVSHAPFSQLLAQSTLVITKASTVIYEALAGGVAVLYFPAKDEVMAEFGEPLGAFEIAANAQELIGKARQYAAEPAFRAKAAQDFLSQHVSIDPAFSANQRIVEAIADIVQTRAQRDEPGRQTRFQE